MSRTALSRIAAVAAFAAGAAACASPTFTATGQLAAEKGPACVYCGGGGRSYIPPFLTDQSVQTTGGESR